MIVRNLMIGLPAILLCMVVQVAFAFWSVRYSVQQSAVAKHGLGSLRGVRSILVAMLAMMLGSVLQIVMWGLLFVALGEFDEYYEAIYHSAVNFASLGYGDIVMSKSWKLLGPLEAVNGVLMIGMSGAALMAVLQQLIRKQQEPGSPLARE